MPEQLVGAGIRWVSVGPLLHIATAPPPAAPGSEPIAFSLAGGAFLGIANPKAWVSIAAVFASVRLADSATVDAAAKVAILTALIILICARWLMAGSSIAPMLRDRNRARVVNVALAAALLVAIGLAVLH